MSKRTLLPAIVYFMLLVGCRGAVETLPPPTTPALVVPVVTTVAPIDTPPPTSFPRATSTSTQARPTRSPTPRVTRAAATATKPRSTTVPAPTPARPGTLSDGNYASAGSIRVQFTVSGGGTIATAGYFNYHCPADGALSTYGFTEPAAIVDGTFGFSALPAPSGGPQVTLVCTAVTLTQARCAIRNLLATKKCLDTPVTANRK